MKDQVTSIEQQARAYAERTWLGQPEMITAANMGYRAGALAESAELTRWNDPKEVLPENDTPVLCRVDGLEWTDNMLLRWDDGSWWFFDAVFEDYETGWTEFLFAVIGWREIRQ